MDNHTEIDLSIKNYLTSLGELQRYGILQNKKDFTSQIGEWLVYKLYGGQRAESAIQKNWDIKLGDKFIQVKTHSKASTNKNRWTSITPAADTDIHELITVIFTPDYKLREFYKTPWTEALKLIRIHKYRSVIHWDHQKQFQINIDELPNQNILSIFR